MADHAYPLAPRLFAGAGALAVGLWFGLLVPMGMMAQGLPYTAIAAVVATAPLVLFLGALAVAPDALQRLLRRVSRLDLRDGGHVAAAVVMAGTLFFVLGYGSLVNGVFAVEQQVVHGESEPPLSGEQILSGVMFNLIVLVIPPVLYVAFVGGHNVLGALRALGLHGDNALRATLVGLATAFGFVVLLGVAGYFFTTFEVEVPENERALQIARSLTVLGALALATGAAVSEEVFFRGFLQPRIGLWGQAIVFSLAHLNYVNVLESVVTLLLGLAFGLLLMRTRNLLAPIAAHFLFNLLMLLAGIYAPDAA